MATQANPGVRGFWLHQNGELILTTGHKINQYMAPDKWWIATTDTIHTEGVDIFPTREAAKPAARSWIAAERLRLDELERKLDRPE